MDYTVTVLVFVLAFSKLSCAERLHEQIYSSVEGGAACFRRLNGTHQAGCSSSDKGAVGVVHMISNTSDVQWLVHNGTAGPYVAVVSTGIFHDVVELLMGHPENVAGVLLYDSASIKASAFTQESRCPNEYSSGPHSRCSSQQAGGIVWNEKGTGLLRRDIPFPIFYLPQSRAEEIVKIEQCYKRFNMDQYNQEGRPLCSLQLNSFMFAAVNSAVCMRRSASTAILTPTKVCDPLGDQNVYYSLFPRGKETASAKKPVTLVTARIDSASLFDGVAPGAASSVVGMVTLITTAATLAKMIPVTDSNLYSENVLFTLFNGEAFDYIGSQRVAYDISRGAWPPAAPLLPTDISLHFEVGQLGGALLANADSAEWPLYTFAPDIFTNAPHLTEFLDEFTVKAREYSMNIQPKLTNNFPPSSLHSFRRILANETDSRQLPEILLVDHDETFSNMFYNSALDESDKIGYNYRNISIGVDGTFLTTEELIANGTMKESDPQVKIAKLATTLTRSFYNKLAKREYTGNITASAHLVDEMLYCFLQSQACRLLLAADYAHSSSSEEALPARATPLYVGVAAWAGPPALFAGNLLALLAGNQAPADNRTACDALTDKEYSYYWLRGWNHSGVCVQTTMNFSQAISPAFITPNYDFASGMYSTWTESVWLAMSARVFVSAGGGGARAAAAAGALATLLAAALTYWLQRHKHVVFLDDTGSIVNNDAATGILRTVNC